MGVCRRVVTQKRGVGEELDTDKQAQTRLLSLVYTLLGHWSSCNISSTVINLIQLRMKSSDVKKPKHGLTFDTDWRHKVCLSYYETASASNYNVLNFH